MEKRIDIEAMVIGENWAAVEVSAGLICYHQNDANAEHGWQLVPERISEKYTVAE